ncbi:hypothetical protein A1F96_07525 [Pyrenophora tritici-repentis]|nr:hypothetical protein L13192_05755 [Pyrenophora tritici-repentis]KAI1681853.1 hypothetical protein KJE20_08724 [Pyrenophora tritici-repentis]PZD26506.1 hypothetical protein A1F96_07525 [Pyrenophora tritici-repentis]
MPYLTSKSTSRCRGINSCEPSSHKSTDAYNFTGTPTPDSENSTSFEKLLVEADHGLLLLSQLPTFNPNELVSNTGPTDLAVLIDRHYRAFRSPASLPNPEWTWKKATMEIIALRKAFPAIENAEDSILAMAAWFHFLCNIDDEIERMDSLERNLVLGRIIEALHAMTLDQPHLTEHIKPLRSIKDIFKRVEMSSHRKILLTTQKRTAINSDPGAFSNIVSQVRMMGHDLAKNDHVKALALASSFIRQCQVVLSPRALPKVFTEVVNVLEALKEESAYLDSRDVNKQVKLA